MNQTNTREYYFDNAKFILIALVVLGHLISPYKGQSQFLYSTYNFIYSFHMPAFILISGFFSKSINKVGYLQKITQKILIPYVVFQIVYSTFYSIRGSELTFTLLDPYWTLWFLLSLLFWNVLLFLFIKIKFPLFIAVIIGISVGFLDEVGSYLSLSRTFVFFPIFLLGYYLNNQHFKYLLAPRMKIISGVFLVGLYLSFYYFVPNSARDWLLASSSYLQTGEDLIVAPFLRLLVYVVAILATISFLSFVPSKRYFFTQLGGRTLYIYLLHGLFIKVFSLNSLFAETNISLGVFFITAISLTLLLGSKPVVDLTRPIIDGTFWYNIPRNPLENKQSKSY